MDYLHFVDGRLNFARYLYDSTVPSFEEIKRKIENFEPPYEDNRVLHPDDTSDEPLFQEEWEQADHAVEVIGMSCLGLVQNALHAFLKTFVKRHWGEKRLAKIGNIKGKKHWLAKYQAAFEDHPEFDWSKSGADLELIEQIIYTRNDFQHHEDLAIPWTRQDGRYARDYPHSRFKHRAGPTWAFERARLFVTKELLDESAIAVRLLASHLVEAVPVVRKRQAAERKHQKRC